MRKIGLVSLLLVAGCGGEAVQNEAAPAAERIQAGQWELTSEVTMLQTLDQGTPKIDTPVGTRATETVCVGSGQAPTDLFSGVDYRCNYDSYYARNGRINVTMQCARDGLSGGVPMTASGTFTQDSLQYDRELSTVLSTDGDVRIAARVTGRRTGQCAPETEGGNQSNGQAG
jgi:hypothetical protein